MTPDLDIMVSNCEALLRKVVPHELRNRNVYVIPMTTISGSERTLRTGWFTSNADEVYRSLIADKWRGRGAALIVADWLGTTRFAAYALHELSHAFEYGLPEGDSVDLSPAPRPELAREVVRTIAAPSPASREVATHSPTWSRLLSHLIARASPFIGGSPRVWEDAFGYPWMRPVAHDQGRTLGHEIGRHLGKPLTDLLTTPPPPAFTKLCDQTALAHLASAKTTTTTTE